MTRGGGGGSNLRDVIEDGPHDPLLLCGSCGSDIMYAAAAIASLCSGRKLQHMLAKQ